MYLGGKAISGPNQLHELANKMADGWKRIMTHSFACPENAAALLYRATPPDRVDDSTVTWDISPDDMNVALKMLHRGKVAEPDEINRPFYRDYADTLGLFSRHFIPDGLSAAGTWRR